MTAASALYQGRVTHRRLRPRAHRLAYRVFWLLLDLDEIDGLDRRLRLFSRNRFNLLSFHDRDHGDGSGAALRPGIESWLARVGVELDGGPIRLLTMPRVLGYVFNPISVYYCHRPDGRLAALVYEVTSTFGRRHAYVAPVSPPAAADGTFRQQAAKALYVSPFMGMEMDYRFRGGTPGETLGLAIDALDADGVLLSAGLKAHRRPLGDRAILAACLTTPLLTLKVVAAIHWEALRLWLKGVRLTRQPPPAATAVSLQAGPRESRLGR
ncbi:DUF1365 family protein [Brevundimonas sp.]|uniref:DUF1365 domain-containing protein n=1 Tax=Brevundimonas sp. TaxID=1871086 RepID=UPI0025BA6D11|nr:DUF1365 family protein [Brevundimonas sp.]